MDSDRRGERGGGAAGGGAPAARRTLPNGAGGPGAERAVAGPQVAAEERVREGSGERGERGAIKRAHGEKEGRKERRRRQAGGQAGRRRHTHAHPRCKSKYISEAAAAGQGGLRGRPAAGGAREVGELGEAR